MSALEDKRREIAELIARALGLEDLATLSDADRGIVDRQTAETIEGCAEDGPGRADRTDADLRLHGLLRQFRALQALRRDEADARLAEEGEVFGREDDA